MATPLGHALAGGCIGTVCDTGAPLRRRLALGALLGIAADVDFLPGILTGDPSRFHHGLTHTLLAVALVVAITLVVASRRRGAQVTLFGLAYASHLVLDLLTYDDSPPQGIPLLWPLWSGSVQSPLSLLPRVIHTDASPFNLHNVGIAVLELTTLGALLFWLVRRRTGPRQHRQS